MASSAPVPGDSSIDLARSGRTAIVSIGRPPVNALTVATYREIAGVFRDLSKDESVSVIVLRSALPTVFSAGADIKDLELHLADADSLYDIDRQAAARDLFDAIRLSAIPVIACVGGIALGAGAVMVACCDFRVFSSSAKLGLTEINVGRCGGARHLSRILPQGVVRRMFFTGIPLDAAEAWRLGAVEELTEAGGELDRALELAELIASKSAYALRLGKEALDGAEGLGISEGYALEQGYTVRLGQSNDAREAAAAFREKRSPVWTGR